MDKKRMIGYAQVFRNFRDEIAIIGGLENDTFTLMDSVNLMSNALELAELLEAYGDE